MSGYSLARTLTVLLFLWIPSLSLQEARSTFYVVQATLEHFGVQHEIQYTECRTNKLTRIYMLDMTGVFLYTPRARKYTDNNRKCL
jgi:hypothetical protein